MPQDLSSAVAGEADQLELALRAAGLDPDSALSWPYWNKFVSRGLRVALAELGKESQMKQSFKGIESDELARARERFNRALSPAAREQIAAAENLVRVAKATTTTTHSAGQRSAAEIVASLQRGNAETQALLDRLDADRTSRQLAEPPALDVIEQLVAKRMRETDEDKITAYSAVLNDEQNEGLYRRYNAEYLAGKYAPQPVPAASARTMGPNEAKIDRLARERAKRDNIDLAQAYSLVLNEQPKLYGQYTEETSV